MKKGCGLPRRPVTRIEWQADNLGLTALEQAELVNFHMILSDGFAKPNPVGG
jgi:hypothetical protein